MNQKDIFKEQLKAAFSDFEAPVPHDGWEKLEQSLNAVARAKIVRRNWYIGSAAAVAAILLGSLFFLKSPQPIEQETTILTEETTLNKVESTDKQDVQVAQADPVMDTEKSGRTKLGRQTQEILVAKQIERKESISQITGRVAEQTPEEIIIAEQSEEKKTQVTEKQKTQPEEKRETSLNQDEIDRLVREFAEAGKRDVFAGQELKDNKNKPLMLALNAKGGLSASQKTVVNSPMTLRSAGVSTDKGSDGFDGNIVGGNLSADYGATQIATNNTANNIAEMEHDQPFSVGFTVSKTIVERLSIETGVVYTYLFSKAKNMNINFRNQETQHFHYLGIPVNMNYNFLNFGKLGLFASAGGMIEKDVYGKQQYQAQVTNDSGSHVGEEWAIKKISQNSPQISVNAGIGVFYPIYGRFNLYGKVGGSYYFDAKNEYKTIYSDKKIILDLNAGIRFDF